MKSNFLIWPLSFSVMAIAVPQKFKEVDFRSNINTIMISINQSSPAFAALEDIRSLNNPISSMQKHNSSEQLLTNVHHKLVEQLPSKFSEKAVVLKPMVISEDMKVDHLAELISEVEIMPAQVTLKEKTEILVRKELESREQTPMYKQLATEAGGQIVVSGGPIMQSIVSREKPQGRAAVKVIRTQNKHTLKDAGEFYISGPLTLVGGVALTNPRDEIHARHTIDGELHAVANINRRDGTYKITVPELSGRIRAELRGVNGTLLAEAEINVLDLAKKKSGRKLSNIPLVLRPAYSGASASIVSAASFGSKLFPVADARLHIRGLNREILRDANSTFYRDETLGSPSTFLLRASQKNYWPTLIFSSSGNEKQIRLYPKSLVQAFLGVSLDKYSSKKNSQQGIIWGRVTYEGSPVEGAQVSLPFEVEKETHYFTGYLPDKTKNATSVNGEFAIAQLGAGEKILVVTIGQKKYWSVFLPVEDGHITYADLDIKANNAIEFKSYDVVTHKPVETVVGAIGNSEELYVSASGIARANIDQLSGTTLLESRGNEEYEFVRTSLEKNQTQVDILQIRKEWLQSLQNEAQIATNSTSSKVIGVVEGDDFEILIGSGELEGISQILYFDQMGKRSQHGVAGGGFVIFNLPHGLRSLTVIPDKSKQVVTQNIFVDDRAVHVQKINLML